MSSATVPAPSSAPQRRQWSWPARLGAIALLLAVLVGPAIVVLALEGSGGDEPEALRVARLPTDVAVDGDTVWIASGRDDRFVAIDAAELDDPPLRHETGSAPLRVAVGAGSVWTANAGDDSVTRLNPLVPGSVGRRIYMFFKRLFHSSPARGF